jgi:hypothetical protein
VRDGDRLAPTFSDIDDELQWSADDEIRLCGGGGMTRRRATWCWLSARGLQWSDDELGRWLGF